MTRTPIIAGNWKMNLLREDVSAYAEALADAGPPGAQVDVVLFPTPVYLELAAAAMPDWAAVGAQDVHAEDGGAYTGDVAAAQILDAGASWALAGHSERRQYHGESNDDVARKARRALDTGLIPVICVGETLEQRQRDETEAILDAQLGAALEVLAAADGAGIGAVVAYEPVWAIGTGLSASPEIAAAVHGHLRRRLNRHQAGLGDSTRILYGGSVNADNCRDLIGRSDIDGFLIGGASLDPASFLRIIRLSTGSAGGS
ncbi:MAG: triose-phosphate isomerase [Acidobacteriota bacterium]|nr:triose-phosphate isomerase [Acidobacteriota bacterium]MDE2921917.1 triose-phosphate isomerase [Acidobacteriota bacterium]MDE3265927.1 triose-phosphate isomerase [Acidobacteriota bacterium]